MSVKLTFQDGISAECDTVSEAAELIRAVTKSDAHAVSRSTSGGAAVSVSGIRRQQGFSAFWAAIDEDARRFLTTIRDAMPDSIEAEALGTELSLELGAVGWVRRRLKKIAPEYGFDFSLFVDAGKDDRSGKPKTVYVGQARLKEEMAAIGK